MERKLVAINGTIGSGKDTFSQVFIDNGFYRVSFAETLKDAVAAIFGWDREMLEGTTDEARKIREQPDEYWSSKLGRDITPRWVLQNLGTDVLRRHFHDNIWVFAAENKIRNLPHERVIITDCRFPNELKMIRDNAGTIIEVQRVLPSWYHTAFKYNLLVESGIEGLVLPTEMEGVHSSEYGWVGINRPDYIVENNSTIDSLHSQAYTILSNIIK
ncbi:putative deoxynucleoside monophosphate kinase [Xanthomonas phage XbC2]|nr:putative deoxynucleoside monophosphate kinase [Xanthomonas phage XbC2]